MRTKLFLFFWFLFLVSASGQNINPDQPIPPAPEIKIGKLENGLTYYIRYNKKPEKRVELRLAVNAGSICETAGQQGLAHFMEHMCFNGTKNFPSNRLIGMLEEMGVKFGAELNASTSFDQTIYMIKIPSDSIEWVRRGFQILEDWAHQVSLEDKEIDKERGVIVEEWRLGLGADERMMQKYIPVLLKGSRYAERLPIGKVDIIKSFPYDTLRAMYKSWYRPDLMAVVVVGDIDPTLAEQQVKQHFSGIPAAVNSPARIEYPVPVNKEPLISIVTDKEASGYSINIFYKHPAVQNVTYRNYRNQLIMNLYTGMLNNRLQEIGQKADAPFLYAGSGYGAFIGRSVDVYSLVMAAKESQIDKSIEVTLTENEKVSRFGFTAPELERQKKTMLSMYENMAKEFDKTESRSYADEYVRNFLNKECIPGIVRENEIAKEFIPGITLEEVNALGKKLVTDDNIAVLVTAKEKEGVIVPQEKEIIDIISKVKASQLEAYIDKASDVPLLPEKPAAGKVISRSDDPAFGITELTFANGVKMTLKPTDFKNDEILFFAFSPGGMSLYPDKDVFSAMLAPGIITQSGVGSFDYMGLQKKLAGNTARLSPYLSEMNEGVNGNCSPKDLETMLQLNYLYFTATRKDENAFNATISRLKNTIKPMRSTPMAVFQDTLSKIVNMNNPRVIAIPSDTQIEQADLNRILEIYRDRFRDASDFRYIMVGSFKVDEAIPMLETYIGGLPSTRRAETWRDVTPGFPKGHVSVDVPKNSEPQSRVTMVWKGDFKWTYKNQLTFTVLMNILSIKCRESMREDQGGVYGVSVSGGTTQLPEPRFTVQAAWGCNPENVGKLSQTVIDEMNKIKNNGPEDVDLNKVKETMTRERETKVKENSFWSGILTSHYMYNTQLFPLTEWTAMVNSIKKDEIKAIAKKYLDTKNYVQVTLVPAAKTEEKK